MIAIVFPGQGSQKVHMGKFLLESYGSLIRDLLEESAEYFSFNFQELFLHGAEEDLQKWAQPSLFIIGALWKKVLEYKGFPFSSWVSYGAGHSLGEYTALYGAGVITFPQGLRIIKKRLECLEKTPPGSMGAVLGIPKNIMEKMLHLWNLSDCFIANDNSLEQVVLSGTTDIMSTIPFFMEPIIKGWNLQNLHEYPAFLDFPLNIQEKMKTKNYQESFNITREYRKIKYIPLRVGGPFHCPLMKECNAEFLEFLKQEIFSEGCFPLIPNTTHGKFLTSSMDLKNALTTHMISPVYWKETMDFFIDSKISGIVEIGPGQVLTNLLKRTSYNGWLLNLDNEDSLNTLEKYLKNKDF